ncbi:hypothetical protein KSZ_61560 [Dictyobacter formicarum]|uniref:Uncharacterized protein n=1 Tax=Dictyobacter formicarum TaxID=2778368 RepID=A0ABQ3VPW8_9CHLR|nr:hypothetical protein KSZ_61560 [Dictyobacter formicarum]
MDELAGYSLRLRRENWANYGLSIGPGDAKHALASGILGALERDGLAIERCNRNGQRCGRGCTTQQPIGDIPTEANESGKHEKKKYQNNEKNN